MIHDGSDMSGEAADRVIADGQSFGGSVLTGQNAAE
ncbi:hypothetical protein C7458_103138 [Williamsia muralis]|nr:hypothetical protein C7458_103138 [Williamsia marianensis]